LIFIFLIYNHNWRNVGTIYTRGAEKSLARQEGNKLQHEKTLIYIYAICNQNLRDISTIYIYIYIRLESDEIFSPSNQIHREVGRAKDLSAPLCADNSLARRGMKQATATEDFDVHISYL